MSNRLKTDRLDMRADAEFTARIDEWRRVQPDIPGRAEAVRRLVEIALTAGKTPDMAKVERKPATRSKKTAETVAEPVAEMPEPVALPAGVADTAHVSDMKQAKPRVWHNDLRPALRKAISAHPAWKRSGRDVSKLTNRPAHEAVACELGIDVDAL
jgi:hypothetical protein